MRVADFPALRVSGKVAPDIVKPLPVTVAELIVTDAVPVEARVSDCVAVVCTVTLPKLTLDALMLSVGTAGFSCSAKLSETLPAAAWSVAVCVELTEDTVAEKLALAALAGTRIEVGTTTAVLLLVRLTLRPPVDAGPVKVTAQVSAPAPLIAELVQDRPLRAGGVLEVVPVPLRLTAAVGLEEELLARVN